MAYSFAHLSLIYALIGGIWLFRRGRIWDLNSTAEEHPCCPYEAKNGSKVIR